MSEHPISELMNTTMERIKQMVDANTIVGQPIITQDGTTVIPITKVSFGFASGGTDHQSKYAKETTPVCFGGGGGAGVTVTPIAFLVIDKTGTRVLPINAQASTTVDRLVEMLPDTVSKISSYFDQHKTQEPEETTAE